MRFQMANIAAASRLCTASYKKGESWARKWMLPAPLFVIRRPAVPWVGLVGHSWREHVRVCQPPPAAVTHTSLLTPPTSTTGAIFSRPAEISISAWMNLWAKHCVSHHSLPASLLSLPIRVSLPGIIAFVMNGGILKTMHDHKCK